MNKLLIADDEISMLRGLEFHLQDAGDYEILTASDKDGALQLLEENEVDLVVSDLMMPDIRDGLAVMQAAKSQWYRPGVLAMTAFDSVENAVSAMKAGADDFVSKGFGLDEMSLRIENMLKKKQEVDRLAIENRILRETIQKQFSDFQIIGKSRKMDELVKKVKKVAEDARATCLIQGESGTGKDLIARSVHAFSKRNTAPFVPINCAAIPENLIESELFGHEKGAFTGAYTTKQGKFENARGGIIFLDEIGELPLPLQVRLLRVLEERSFYRIGGKNPIEVDVMVIAATNSDLSQMVNEGNFREDLFFRLNVVNLWVPPLRERREDIRLLAQFFLDKFNRERRKNLKFSQKALEMLDSYNFPGNVRELRNIVEDAFVFAEGQWISPQNISLRKSMPGRTVNDEKNAFPEFYHLSFRDAMDKFERDYVVNLLQENFWNINAAAKQAGLTREWLSKKIKKMDIKKM